MYLRCFFVLHKLKFLLGILLCCIFCMNVAYGQKINNLEDILDNTIDIKNKLEYLDALKRNTYLFSKEDVSIIVELLMTRLKKSNVIDADSDEHTWEKERIIEMDLMIEKLLEIFLNDGIDDRVLDQPSLSGIAIGILRDFPLKVKVPISSKLRFIALKVLIKVNILKPECDDIALKNVRAAFIEADDSIEDKEKAIEERNRYYEAKWELREDIENYIFEPILLNEKIDNPYVEEDPRVLYEYEKYLLDHIKYFYINSNLKNLVEDAFLVTKYPEFNSKYVDTMFFLDMKEAILRIISDSTRQDNLREQAIEVGIKLLYQIDSLYFKQFSDLLLYRLEKIVKDVKEPEKFKKKVQEKIKEIKSIINNHDEIKHLKDIVLNKFIDVLDKLKYLNSVSEDIFFSQKDSGFIKEVLNNEDIDILVKAAISRIVCKSEEFSKMDIGVEDRESIDFLNRVFVSDDNVGIFEGVRKVNILREKIMKQLYRFDMWDTIMEIVSSKDEQIAYRKLAIKTSLDLLVKTKHFEEFSSAFLEVLQRIADDNEESVDLRNIADYILLYTKSDKIKLKEGMALSCKLLFILKDIL